MARSKLVTYECPSCKLRQTCVPAVVAHRCRWNKNKLTKFVEVHQDADAEA